jgi:CBS domain-containing protein
VIFAMEVILTEYTLIGFAPVILAAVAATAVSRVFFGSEALLSVFSLVPYRPEQLLFAALIGLASGLLASGLTRSMGFIAAKSRHLHPWQRCLIAGALTGLLAVPAPVIMGIGYDTLRETVEGSLPLTALVVLVVFKLAATSIGLGLGLPGGVIGPTLVIGAGAGSALGVVFALLFPHSAQPPALSALLGMMAMMGATLHAPLAALTALVELVANPDFIFPGMLAVIIAFLATRVLTRTDSVFEAMAHARGIRLHSNPIQQSLRRMAVGRATNESFRRVPRVNPRGRLTEVLQAHPDWLVIDPPDGGLRLVAAAEVARLLEIQDDDEIDLMEATLRRSNMQPIAHRSTLAEALRRMDAQDVNALYVVRPDRPDILGVVTRSDVERSYRA